jgi:uncharacterized membrane protein
MKKICFTFILCVLVLCPFQAAYSDTPYILFNIDATGAVETVAMDINNHGKIVGYYKDSTGYVFGFLRDGSVVVPFAYPGSEYTYAMGINDVDWIVGHYYDASLFSWGNFLHNGSDFVPVYPPCGEGFSYVNDINNTYWMVGNCGNGDVGFVQSGENHALFSFPLAPYTFAFGMNDNYLIAGCDHNTSYFGTVPGGFYPFQVPGAQLTWAYGVNNAALIAGTYKYANKDYGFVRETSGKIATIHMPGAGGTIVYGINDHRQLVGTYKDASNIIHAFAAVPTPNPLPADLIVSEIVIDPPDPDPGEAVDVHVTVENQGAYAAGGFFLDWYANESLAPSPPPFGNRREYVPSLAAGATYTMSTTWTYSTLGTYQMCAYADSGYGVYESNENNNVLGPVETVVGACKGDFDDDKDVDGSDLSVFAADFGRTDCASGDTCEGDFDKDIDVDGSDLAVFAADFGRTDCP